MLSFSFSKDNFTKNFHKSQVTKKIGEIFGVGWAFLIKENKSFSKYIRKKKEIMNMGYIYKITNIVNNKIYIGQTTKKIKKSKGKT